MVENDSNKILSEINFQMGKKLGEGMFSTVKIATHSLTNEQVAIKILEKTKITKIEDKERINHEISIIKKVNHFNIVKLYAVIETKLIIYLIQEHIQGKDFMEYLTKKGKLKESDACKYFHQIISGLEYLHQCGIAHRDFKPENILLTNDNQILKIIDFGLSNTYKKGQLLKTGCGSPCYVPPEMIKEEGYNGALADIWSAGVILYLMLCGNLPFYHDDNQILYEKILAGKYDTPSHLSEDVKDLLSKILEVDPKKRINFEGIKSHPWFNLIDKKYLMNKGIIVNEDIFPIDEKILQDMEKMGFNKVEIRYNIIKNYHNKITTTYDLLLKKKINMGKKSVADLNSDLYSKYINDSKNKISHYGNLENVLKNRIGDDGKPVSSIPDWPENKYDDNNENIIKGDSGSVIERLIKSGRFTYDEENMCINRAKPALRKHISNDPESRFKTISSMQPSKKKFNKVSDKENESQSPDVNKIKRNKVHFEEENKNKKKEEDEDWFKEMEETIDKEIENIKVLRENKTSNLHKTKKNIPQMLSGNESGNLEEGKKSLKNQKNGYKSSKNFKIGAESSSKKPTSKFATNPNAKSMKALKKKNTFGGEESNTKNKSNIKTKNSNQIIKKNDGVRSKSGKRKETSVERIDRGSKKGGKFKKISGEIEDASTRGTLRRNQSCERRFNKIKI